MKNDLREDAILLCGFIYGACSSLPTAVRDAIRRITDPAPAQPEIKIAIEPTVRRAATDIELKIPAKTSIIADHLPSRESPPPIPPAEQAQEPRAAAQPESADATEIAKPRKKQVWSPEARAAAAERMRARIAAGKMARKAKDAEPGEA